MLIKILYLLFALFLIYTWVYILQWIIGLCISLYRLSEASQRKRMVRWTVPNELAKENTVSVIIAAYNEEACVIDTIESILSEDYPNLEVILVDDGSADHTAQKVIDHYGLEYSRRLMAKAPQSRGKKEYYEEKLRNGHVQRSDPRKTAHLYDSADLFRNPAASVQRCGCDRCGTFRG